MALTTIFTGMEQGPEKIDANFKELNGDFKGLDVAPDILYGKAEDHGSGLNDCNVTGLFLRIPIDPKSRTALLFYKISINNAANDLGIPAYQNKDVFKFDSSVMVNDNNQFGGEAATFGALSINGWGGKHFQSMLHSDGMVTIHVNGDAVKDGGADASGIRMIKY